jgi:hypothetical protein
VERSVKFMAVGSTFAPRPLAGRARRLAKPDIARRGVCLMAFNGKKRYYSIDGDEREKPIRLPDGISAKAARVRIANA